MTCDDFLDVASEFVYGTLDAPARAAAEGHLAGCEACRHLAADLRRVQQTSGAL